MEFLVDVRVLVRVHAVTPRDAVSLALVSLKRNEAVAIGEPHVYQREEEHFPSSLDPEQRFPAYVEVPA